MNVEYLERRPEHLASLSAKWSRRTSQTLSGAGSMESLFLFCLKLCKGLWAGRGGRGRSHQKLWEYLLSTLCVHIL